MNPNENPSSLRQAVPGKPWSQFPRRPPMRDDILKTGEIQIERKSFIFLLKENPRGRFLRIIEQGGAKSTSIIVPSNGLHEFNKLLAEMLKVADVKPSQPS
jgi:PurA ssDNA and RNA-binding protein